MTEKSSTGAKTAGENINWRYLNEERIEDPIINALVKEATSIYIKNGTSTETKGEEITILQYIEQFNIFLKDNKYKFAFYVSEVVIPTETDKKKKPTKKEQLSKKEQILKTIKEESFKKEIKAFLDTLVIVNNVPILNKKNIESYFSVLFWSIYLITNKKKNIDVVYYLNNAFSLSRAITESADFLTERFRDESIEILNTIESIVLSKTTNLFKLILDNQFFILESHWDTIKPKSISLYNEQKDILTLVSENLNSKKLIFFEMPPANGKTVLSAILAKIIAHKNKENSVSIPGYKRKTMLYICYNSIVRNEVAKLCITHNVDVKYWLAVYKMDKEDGSLKTFLRPYKNCYQDWNKSHLRTKKETETYDASKWKRFSSNIYEQWQFFLDETRPICEQHTPVKDIMNPSNLPEMIISDLESAYVLLKHFPDTFVTYFDEAFASSNLEITAKIMSVLGLTVLVSATLAKPEEIPTVINNYKDRHGYQSVDKFLHIIKSTKQHISCTFIDENGYMIPPHYSVNTIEELQRFMTLLERPLVRRGYSPEVVFHIYTLIEPRLPNHLKFNNVFNQFGMINHETLRDYMCNILRHIVDNNDNELFELLKRFGLQKMTDMNVNTIFTNSAIHYQNNKTLHIAIHDGFNQHVEDMAEPFLRGSPKVCDIILQHDRESAEINKQIASEERNGSKDSPYIIAKLRAELDNVRLKWPSEYILNSRTHATKFGNLQKLNFAYNDIFARKSDLELLNDTRTKLLFSGIGIYQPEDFSSIEMDFFLRKKDAFRFILSTPAIVYGTNISLSMIDIDHTFVSESTKNTLYQLIGRAGRKGKSDSATIIFRNNQMLDIILRNDDFNIEAIQIEENFSKIIS